MTKGSLTVVGTGYQIAGHITLESRVAIEQAGKLFHLVNDEASRAYLEELNPSAESLAVCYREGKPGLESSEEMVERILAALRGGLDVCVAFSGHPAVFLPPAHEAVRRARLEGHPAKMLPGISAQSCLFAEVGVDPGVNGCQVFEATDFLIRRRQFDPTSALILLQVGAIGLTRYVSRNPWCAERLRILVEVLEKSYSPEHEVVVYHAEVLPNCESSIQHVPLERLPEAGVTFLSTLYVPPRGVAPEDQDMRRQIGDYYPFGAEPAAAVVPADPQKL